MSKTTIPSRFLTAGWHYLVMQNFEVDPAILLPRVPTGTTLDLWEGKALVSMVGFLFKRTRVKGIPIPFHLNFEEINLRFYVRREVDGEVRRGVVFVKEIVPRAAIAFVARVVYNENYVALPTRHQLQLPTSSAPVGHVAYEWRTGEKWNRLAATIKGEPYLASEDSHESFITEHYWGYAAQPDGSTVEYQVEHPRWNAWNAVESEFDCDVGGVYGEEFVPFLSSKPYSAFVADGSDIVVRSGRKM
ncbi:MAG: DUF2071 domain-containing protein [Ignavibacteriae bacterium]|nr:DUF2071 domain-containing protein [Ignavibacteriota bacterium]MCB9216097.1 DUF2071 domain-containing protein [Ignavibacteria bacterium]